MPTKKKPSRAEMNTVMRKAHRLYGHRSSFSGADVGYVWRGEDRTDEIGVRIHVKRKIPLGEIAAEEVLPTEIDGIPIDIIEGPYRIAPESGTGQNIRRVSHILGGVSVGRRDMRTGTAGALVIDQISGRPSILSNWHVLAGPTARRGDAILQPGLLDDPREVDDPVAALSRWILDADGDAAIAQLTETRPWLPTQIGTHLVGGKIRDSRLGEILSKVGRTTGETSAKVDGEGIYRLTYEVAPGRVEARDIHGFKLVSRTPGNPDNEELSASGDSGAAWINPGTGDVVGLHFAGETSLDPRAEHAIACNMSRVAERLQFRMATFDDLLEIEAVPQGLTTRRDRGRRKTHLPRISLSGRAAARAERLRPTSGIDGPEMWRRLQIAIRDAADDEDLELDWFTPVVDIFNVGRPLDDLAALVNDRDGPFADLDMPDIFGSDFRISDTLRSASFTLAALYNR